ncbi:trypsin-like serine peptidase [Nonomuraea candida]|uniref:trypsin-like serine peptidase n=1 Tax=Nonomuraea candida TaxID=359159 RepID=UPI0005BD237B|nr:trypsin-like peptidase domain-containing protein [Nonomuraea candida]
MHRRVSLLAAIALALAGALVPAGGAQARAVNGLGPRPVEWSATDSPSQRRTVSQYWTTRRMLAAQPLDTPAPRRGARPSLGDAWAARGSANTTTRRSPWTFRGSSWSVGGTAPVTPATTVTGTGTTATEAAAGRGALVPNSRGLRWTDGGAIVRTTGRVFFTTADGRNSSCSGSAVTSANESVVITAGHCVKLNGAAHRNWVFVPAFDDGRRPFGTWVAARMLTTRQWNAREDINFDLAAVVVAPLNGRTLTDVVGGQGVAFNQPRQRQMYAFGYPAAEPFDGSDLIYCSGRSFNDTVMTADQGLRCGMTGGSSGGPWFQGFDESTGLGWLNSVNSFTYNFAPNFMFGPFFGDEAMSVYQAAQNINEL